jgi:N-acetylmuramoyl-L-alanine amidase-like protein
VATQPPSLVPPWVEQHAGQIPDPVERLRFLRLHASGGAIEPARWRLIKRPLLWVLAGVVSAIVPGPIPTGTAETFAREQRLLVPVTNQAEAASTPASRVWRVDYSETSELYSNGLRIDLTFAVSNRARAPYPILSLAGAAAAAGFRDTPAGIVYHTTESHLAPFQEDENRRLKQLARNLLEVIRRERAYHYVIDRFGRVFRVVEESDAANHAGASVWADSQGIYVNLNDSFLGVAFEGQTGAAEEVSPAQLAAAKVLTEMLRSRYRIPAENCVTHAQVSVNPSNMRIGSHTDWAATFPFARLGLPDNYAIALPSLYAFGFDYDDSFMRATGARWKGLDLAEEQIRRQAALNSAPPAQYRKILQHRYKDIAVALKEQAEGGS